MIIGQSNDDFRTIKVTLLYLLHYNYYLLHFKKIILTSVPLDYSLKLTYINLYKKRYNMLN